MGKPYSFKAKVWIYPSESGAWHFVYVDKALSRKLKKKCGKNARGFGSLPVSVRIGKTTWETSIFPESREGTYLLPLKLAVRRAEGISDGDMISVSLMVR